MTQQFFYELPVSVKPGLHSHHHKILYMSIYSTIICSQKNQEATQLSLGECINILWWSATKMTATQVPMADVML